MEGWLVKMLVLALWVTAITALASQTASHWQSARAAAPSAENAPRTFEYRKTRVINVPIIAEGALLGYVIVQFLYGINVKAAEKLNVSPDAFIMDDAFRTLYGDPSLDFRHLEKYDITGLTTRIRSMVNDKLGQGLVKEILIQDFSYMPKDQAPR
jgi:hypothetical protein